MRPPEVPVLTSKRDHPDMREETEEPRHLIGVKARAGDDLRRPDLGGVAEIDRPDVADVAPRRSARAPVRTRASAGFHPPPHGSRDLLEIDDACPGNVEGGDARGLRFDLSKFRGGKPGHVFDAVGRRPPVKLLQGWNLVRGRSPRSPSRDGRRDALFLAELE